jgi:very-short-patch-repair endonuclease
VSRSPRRGLRHVLEALAFVDPRLETPLEAISWCHLCRSGLPLPLLQQWVTGASGRRYRVDFFWPEFHLIGEADGAMKYRSAADVMAEKDRHADLGDAGHGFVRWTWSDAWMTQVFLGRIEQAMNAAARS